MAAIDEARDRRSSENYYLAAVRFIVLSIYRVPGNNERITTTRNIVIVGFFSRSKRGDRSNVLVGLISFFVREGRKTLEKYYSLKFRSSSKMVDLLLGSVRYLRVASMRFKTVIIL